MRYSVGQLGRVVVGALEEGDRLPDSLERLALESNVSSGICILLGGISGGGTIVVGPKDSDAQPVDPILHLLDGVHEVIGLGTLFPDKSGTPRAHLHAALGRGETTKTGCIRLGVDSWKLCEIIIIEIKGSSARREFSQEQGFDMLIP